METLPTLKKMNTQRQIQSQPVELNTSLKKSGPKEDYVYDYQFVTPAGVDYYPKNQKPNEHAMLYYKHQIKRVPIIPPNFGYQAVIKNKGRSFGQRIDLDYLKQELSAVPPMNQYEVGHNFGKGGRKQSLGRKLHYSGVFIPNWF